MLIWELKKKKYGSIFFFFFFMTQNSCFLIAAVAVDMYICLFIPVRRRVRVADPCHDLGEYRSISCSFNALVFIIHGFSSTLNRITWLLCKDSGLGTLMWETLWLWPQDWIYNFNAPLPWAQCLQTLHVNVCDLRKLTVLINFDLWYSHVFSEPPKWDLRIWL